MAILGIVFSINDLIIIVLPIIGFLAGFIIGTINARILSRIL